MTSLFDSKAGIFRGFKDGGMEFHADLVLPHKPEFQDQSMYGQFILVELGSPDEAVLGRISKISTDGKMAYGQGEEHSIRAAQEGRKVKDEILERYLRYKVGVRVLGAIRNNRKGRLTFVPSLRRLPPAGSAVAFPTKDVLRELTGHHDPGALIGWLALGEYFYGPQEEVAHLDWARPQHGNEVEVRFHVSNLVSRRTFVLARAGFGKSNLVKLLFSSLYEQVPTVTKRGDVEVPVGTVLFDPDGEYFWPDDKGRPGLCDVSSMSDRLVVFTDRKPPSGFYGQFVAAGTKIDLRRLDAATVVGTFLSGDRQQQQNVIKMRSLNSSDWGRLVDAVHKDGNNSELDDIKQILRLESSQESEALAARANATRIVRALHDPSSLFLDSLMRALREGKLCVVDVSQKSSEQAMVLSGLVLDKIFTHNQDKFTEATPKTIPTIAVIEEAQAVLNDKSVSAQPFVRWVKEGRKYDLGAVLVTQQPGSIPNEILSQGDNWFLFHLLSSVDLKVAQSANAHFGGDVLASLLNEPIPGQGIFWSSAGRRQFPIPLRVRSFERMVSPQDPKYSRPAGRSYATDLSDRMWEGIPTQQTADGPPSPDGPTADGQQDQRSHTDPLAAARKAAIDRFKADTKMRARVESEKGIPWGGLKRYFAEMMPDWMEGADEEGFKMVAPAMNEVYGKQDEAWAAYKPEGSATTWVHATVVIQ